MQSFSMAPGIEARLLAVYSTGTGSSTVPGSRFVDEGQSIVRRVGNLFY